MAGPKPSKQVAAGGNPRPPNAGKGRVKGVPNRSTRDVREVVAEFAKAYAPKFEGWIDRVAATDPARAAELYLRSLEYHIPKLTRSHITAGAATLEELVLSAIGSGEHSAATLEAAEVTVAPDTTYQRVLPPADPAPAVHVTPPRDPPARLIDPESTKVAHALFGTPAPAQSDQRSPAQIERQEYEQMLRKAAQISAESKKYDVFENH